MIAGDSARGRKDCEDVGGKMTTETKLPAEVEQAIETAAEHIQSLHGGARASHKSLITCHLALVLAEQVKAAGA